jgi:hypothetical protein
LTKEQQAADEKKAQEKKAQEEKPKDKGDRGDQTSQDPKR